MAANRRRCSLRSARFYSQPSLPHGTRRRAELVKYALDPGLLAESSKRSGFIPNGSDTPRRRKTRRSGGADCEINGHERVAHPNQTSISSVLTKEVLPKHRDR